MLLRGLCALLFLGLTAERNGDPLLYNALWRSPLGVFAPLFDSLPVVRQPAWTLLLLALLPLAYVQRGALRRRAWPMDLAIGLSAVTLLFGVALGVARGGSAYHAYFQLNALAIALLVALLLLASMRSIGSLRFLGGTILAAALVRAGLALYFFFAFVRGHEPYPPHMTSHEDSPLFAAGLLIALAGALASRSWRGWAAAAVCLVPLLLAMKVNSRRIVWVEVALGVAFLYLMLPPGALRRRVNRWLLLLLPVLALYITLGWGRSGALFTPLRAFDSMLGGNPDPSTLARHEEDLNLVLTYIRHPILGSGWGHPFVSVSSYYAYFGGGFDAMYKYTPHNSLAALAAFSGLVGLVGILGVVPVAAFLGARGSRAASTATERAAAMAAVSFLPVYGAQAGGDIGLQSVTNALLLAAALAVAGRVSVSTGAWPERRSARRWRRHPVARRMSVAEPGALDPGAPAATSDP